MGKNLRSIIFVFVFFLVFVLGERIFADDIYLLSAYAPTISSTTATLIDTGLPSEQAIFVFNLNESYIVLASTSSDFSSIIAIAAKGGGAFKWDYLNIPCYVKVEDGGTNFPVYTVKYKIKKRR